MMSKVIGYLFYTVFYEYDFFLFLNRKRSLTSDIEQGFMAIAGVSNVGGNTAKNSSIWLLHPGDLQDTHGEKRVPGLDRQTEREEKVTFCQRENRSQSKRYWIKKKKDSPYYLSFDVLMVIRSFSHVMLASGILFTWHWKRATPPSSTVMDSGWVWNLGRAVWIR